MQEDGQLCVKDRMVEILSKQGQVKAVSKALWGLVQCWDCEGKKA